MARPPIWTPEELQAFADAAIADLPINHSGRDLRLPRVREKVELDLETRRRLSPRIVQPRQPLAPPPAEPRQQRPRRPR